MVESTKHFEDNSHRPFLDFVLETKICMHIFSSESINQEARQELKYPSAIECPT